MCDWLVMPCIWIEICFVKPKAIMHIIFKSSYCQSIPPKIYSHIVAGETEAGMF